MVQGKKKYVVLDDKVCCSNIELNYGETVGTTTKSRRILAVESFKKPEMRSMDDAAVKKLLKRDAFLKSNHPNAEIVSFLQFNKGTKRSAATISAAIKSQANADYRVLYEADPKQGVGAFEAQLNEFVKIDGPKMVVLEAESRDITSKISATTKRGITQFIVIGGKYPDETFWQQKIVQPIHQQGAKVMAVVLKRMNRQKESYLKPMLLAGVDWVAHGAARGWDEDGGPVELLLLDSDMVYRPIDKAKDVAGADEIRSTPASRQYALGRLLSLENADVFAKALKKKLAVKA